MNYLQDRYWKVMSLPTILWKINLQLVFVVFISVNCFAQENPIENQISNQPTILPNQNLHIAKLDSLKKVEARRIYMSPIPVIEEKKESIKPKTQ